MAQRINEQIGILPAIEAEGHFVQVGREMFGADAMPCSEDAALQERERRLNRVRVDVAFDIDLRLMLDCLMPTGERSVAESCGVGVQFVGHDYIYIFAHRVSHILGQRSGFDILRVKEPEITAALTDADHNLLFAIPMTGLAVSLFTCPDIRFVNLNRPIHHRAFNVSHRLADSMAEIPRSFVAPDAKSSLDLVRGDSLPRFDEKQDSHEPSFQRQVGVVKDRLRGHAKLVMALAAFKLRVLGQIKNVLALAAKALNAVRPAEFLQQSAALFVRGIHVSEVIESHG